VKNANGQLALANSVGALLEPPITIPDDVTADGISIGQDGVVSVRTPGAQELQEVGQIELARFINPEGLLQIGKNMYLNTDASGEAITSNPQEDGAGSIQQGSLESSNVEPVRELVDLILTQRGFEMNSQSVQSADESMRVVTNLRR
jgi:flagellar basal-body rod protein FlgG